jgi:hypothetical protein
MCRESANWREWSVFFERRANRPMPQLDPETKDSRFPASLARSLAIFQLGESGGGTVVDQARNTDLEYVDDFYVNAVALFVKEENRHAEILARCVDHLGGKLISENWTARLFVAARRLLGLRLKVMVLLAAEVVGLCYYNLLAAKLDSSPVGSLLSQLVDDERAHLQFHCRFLNLQTGNNWRRAVFVVAWRVTMIAAAIAVLVDHYPAIRDLGIKPTVIWRRWMLYSRLAERLVVAGPEPRELWQTT